MYNDNYLISEDVEDLENAGLDVDKLADMREDERYDAIDEAGLNPFDYDYGFWGDECLVSIESVPQTEECPYKCAEVNRSKAPKRRVKKISRREMKKLRKAYTNLEATRDALLAMRL